MFNTASVVNYFHKGGIVLPGDKYENEIEIESESNTSVVQNWQHLCKKL
jgi:hypothetical protein